MPAETAATSTSLCPLCGDGEGVSSSERKRRLALQLRSLENGSARVRDFSARLSEMCGVCRVMMIGINSDDDRLELRDRLQKELEPPATERHRTAMPGEAGDGAKLDREHLGSRRDPEERPATSNDETREKMLDKTLADSFPTSDPPSSIPDPAEDDSMAA
jgi:hypothetical protein